MQKSANLIQINLSSFNKKYGPWAIVAGAAEGLGEAYSIALAKRNVNLLMVDVQPLALKNLAQNLEEKYTIHTRQLHLDLSDKNAVDEIMKISSDIDVGLLVYNAAYSLIKPFINHTSDELNTFIEVNARTQIQLVHSFSKRLIEQKRGGGILMMSSLAGLIGMQLVSPYAATKAFTWNLAESLYHELKPYKIDVTACLAGMTDTPALRKSNPTIGFPKPQIMKPEDVANEALENLGRTFRFIPGFSNRINYFILTRLLPRKMASGLANKTITKIYASPYS